MIADANHVQPPLLAYYLKVDEQIVRLLLGTGGIDPRLVPFCEKVESAACMDNLPLGAEIKRSLPPLLANAREVRHPLRVYFHGPQGVGKRYTAEALANEVSAPLLAVDIVRVLATSVDFEHSLKMLFREAWFQDAILYLDGLDVLRSDERAIPYQRLMERLAEDAGITILSGMQPWVPSGRGPKGVITVPFPIPDFAGRLNSWQASLAAEGITLDEYDLAALADRFRLTPGQITNAVATANNYTRWPPPLNYPTTQPINSLTD